MLEISKNQLYLFEISNLLVHSIVMLAKTETKRKNLNTWLLEIRIATFSCFYFLTLP